MKNYLRIIAECFRTAKSLKKANAYIDYLEKEVDFRKKRNSEITSLMAERCAEIDALESMNVQLNEKNLRLINLSKELRDIIHKRGATDAEHDFIDVCKDIYSKGKMISRQRFDASMYDVLNQRKMACINRFEGATREDVVGGGGREEGGKTQGKLDTPYIMATVHL
jgi:hypothetical protein